MQTSSPHPNPIHHAHRHDCQSTYAQPLRLGRKLAGALLIAAGFATSAPAQDLTPDSIAIRASDGKRVATFSTVASGTWTIPAGVSEVAVLVIGGGGSGAAGGTWNADGGGAGGVTYYPSHAVTGGAAVPLSVGDGGAALASDGPGNTGASSVFDTLTASGGEGGLSSRGGNSGGVNLAGVVTSGGLGATHDGSNGGGGAGQDGSGAFGDSPGGNGLQFDITGTNLYYAGGGGGGYSGANNAGGLGGGGKGATDGEAGFGHDAVDGLGGGGGASRDHAVSGAGGSGIVIIAYGDSSVVTHTVSFESNGGSSVSSQLVPENGTAVQPADPTLTGYTFNGWFSDQALTLGYDFQAPVTADRTLYAKWTISSYTLTYLAGDNGSITGDSPQTVEYGASGTEVTAVPAAGYRFHKWSDESLSNPRTDGNVTADITVMALFVAPFSPDSVVTRGDGKTVATFSTVGSGTWTIPDGVTEVEVLVVGGGGSGAAGGTWNADGGGAGGVGYYSSYGVTGGSSVGVAVGLGGAALAAYGNGNNGAASSFGSLTAAGGEGGLPTRGGNSGGLNLNGVISSGGLGALADGANGGGGAVQNGSGDWGASPGGNGHEAAISGTLTYYAGGGGGGYSGGNNLGGLGGGGKGATDGEPGFGHDATFYGGGGGASRDNPVSGAGYDGVVIVAYQGSGVPTDPYDTWAGSSGYNLTGDRNADDDGDGLSNFEEFAFGLNPTSGTSLNPLTDLSTLKSAGTFSYTRLAGSGLTYTVWTSTTLLANEWTFVPAADQEAGAAVSGVETVRVTLPSIPTGDKLFVRVKAEK